MRFLFFWNDRLWRQFIVYDRENQAFAGKTFAFPALSPVAQDLVVAGGAEAAVAKRLKSN